MTRGGTSCCVVLLGVLLCVFLVSPSRTQQPTFTFPNQWEAVVGGWFSDKLLPDARSTGYMYVDYTYGPNGAERIDEVWNITAIAGTEYAKWNIHSDVHMFYGPSFTDPGFFFYSNGTGSYCEASPSSLIGQCKAFLTVDVHYLRLTKIFFRSIYQFLHRIRGLEQRPVSYNYSPPRKSALFVLIFQVKIDTVAISFKLRCFPEGAM